MTKKNTIKETPIKAGSKAPDFELKDKDGKVHSLKQELKGKKRAVVYFYPSDNTPGCTVEAKEFSRDNEKFEEHETVIIGIAGGDEKTKTKFVQNNNLKILLLSDSDFSTAKAYGVYGEKTFMGKKFMGIFRTTFVIDNKMKVIKVFEKVNYEGHSAEVCEFVQQS